MPHGEVPEVDGIRVPRSGPRGEHGEPRGEGSRHAIRQVCEATGAKKSPIPQNRDSLPPHGQRSLATTIEPSAPPNLRRLLRRLLSLVSGTRCGMPAPRIATSGVALVAIALSLLLRACDPPRLPWEDHAQPVPGTGGNVFLLEDFLSEAEVRHIMAAGRDALGLGNPSAAPPLVVERSARGGDGGGLSGVRRLCSSLVAAFDRNERFLKPTGGMHATKPGATSTTRNFDEDAVREATQLLEALCNTPGFTLSTLQWSP